MALAMNDIVQVSFRGTLFGQRILNILHYVVSVAGTGPTQDQLRYLAIQMASGGGSIPGLETHWLACLGVQYTLDSVRAQRVYPTRTVYSEWLANDTGLNADDCTTANVAVSLLKKTLTPGRMGVGRMQLSGIPQTAYAGGLVNAGFISGPLADLRADLNSTFTTDTLVVTYAPCLFNPTALVDKFSIITDFFPQDTVRTMHRRTVRLGE